MVARVEDDPYAFATGAGQAGANEAAVRQGAGEVSDDEALRERIIDALRTVYDPEIPVDIYEMGLVYDIDIQPVGKVLVSMTLTSPGCPVAGSLPEEVQEKVREVEGVTEGRVELVWDPPWEPSRMSEAARLTLGFF